MTAATHEFDIAVIGAGINGAGIARDAALRGLRVVVIEQNDLCSGTSAWSSRLIHGGLRYLEYGEIPLVYESLHERRHLRQIASHLVKPIRICIPIYKSGRRSKFLIRLGMIAYDLLSMGKSLPRHDMLSAKSALFETPGLAAEQLTGMACYYDAQVRYVERLVLENLLAARAAGARIITHSRVTKILTQDGSVSAIRCSNTHDNDEQEFSVRVVVNAAGPWVDSVLATTGFEEKPLIGGTKGSHIIVGEFNGAPSDACYVEAAADGRPFFIIPWNGLYLIGTTDQRFCGRLESTRASREEIDYLLAETNRVFPSAALKPGDIHYAYAGVRPLPHRDKGPESAITRKHIIRVNKSIAKGLVSIIGGKLTTYRNLAEQAVDRIGKILGRKLPPCRTHDTNLPGAFAVVEAKARLEELGVLSDEGIARTISVYGGRASAIAALADADPALARAIDAEATVLAAEVVHVLREEMAWILTDVVHRRMMIGLGPDQGRPLYQGIAAIAAVELGWTDDEVVSQLQELVAYSNSLTVAAHS